MIRALIVDDEEEICDFLKEVLTEMGLEVACAFSGEDAIYLIKKQNWQIAIIDLKLSTSITGVEVIKAIRGQQPKCATIALSGYIDISLKQEVERLGVAAFFEKPKDINPNVFRAKMKLILDNLKQKGN